MPTSGASTRSRAGSSTERIGNERLGGAQYPTITLHWGSARAALDGRRVRGTYGHYTVTRVYNSGDIHTNGVGMFLQDAWTVRPEPHGEPRPAHRQGRNSVVHGGRTRASSSASSDKISPRVGLRVGHARQRQMEGLRQLGACSTTPPSSRCRAGCSGPSTRSRTTTRSTRSTGRRSSARIRRSPVPAAPAPTSSRSISGTRPTRRTTSSSTRT